MTDPFAVISGAAGVVSLGITACQGLVAYYGPFKAFSTETESFVTSVNGLSATLELLKSKLNRLQNPLNPYVADELQLVADRINDCEGTLQRLSQTLQKCQGYDPAGTITRRGKAFARAQYPFKRGTLVFLTQTVMGLQSNLDIALHALHLAMSHTIQEQNTSFLAVSRSMASDVATLPGSLQHLHSNQQEIIQIVTSIQQLQLKSIDQSVPLPPPNRIIPRPRMIAGRSGPAHPRLHAETGSRGKHCTCTKNGSWLFSSWGMLSGIRGHQFGCPKYYDREVTTLVNGKFTILNMFLGWSAHVHVALIHETASVIISPTISIWPVVDEESPAFRIMYELAEYENINDALADLRSLYNKGRASPRDTLPDGQTLMHFAVRKLSSFTRKFECARYCQFVEGLVKLSPVGLNQQSDCGGTVFDTLLQYGTCNILYDTAYLSSNVRALASLSGALVDHGAVATIDSATKLPRRLEVLRYEYFTSNPNYLFLPIVINDRGAEEFPFSPLELAVLQRDEGVIRELLGGMGPDHRLSKYERCAYRSAISWPRGLRIMLDFHVPESLQFLLHEAIVCRQYESAAIVMNIEKCYISNFHILRAAKLYSPALFKMLATNLAVQRRSLRNQASRSLSPSAFRDLGLSDLEELLDSKAFEVETALGYSFNGKRLSSAEIPSDYDASSSVYHLIGSNLDAANILYSQGFTNVNQLDVNGLTPLSKLDVVDASWDLDKFLEMCEWLLDKGASLHSPSLPPPWLLTPGHNVAYGAGEWLRQEFHCTWYDRRSECSDKSEIWISEVCQAWFTQCVNHWSLLQEVFKDTQHHDGCFCACASDGCLPLNVFLKTALDRYWYPSRSLFNSIPGYIVAGILDDQHPSAPSTSQLLHDRVTPAAIRICTFETLGLRHTCRRHYGYSPEFGGVKVDDIAEVQEEERFLIDQLEQLVSEFELKYKELCVSLPEFLRGYWAERMEEVLTEVFDEDEAHAMEEAGVVLDT